MLIILYYSPYLYKSLWFYLIIIILFTFRYVVPYNKVLSKKLQAHLNVEWCNQLGSIKYLFKYISKGPDRTIVSFVDKDREKTANKKRKERDEIADYYSCRYISACEASWRLFGFEIQYRFPPVERLSFHLQNEQPVVYGGNEVAENVVSKPTIATSQFLEWMECNKHDDYARTLTYIEFPGHYVWNKSDRKWTRRKRPGGSLGRINYVSVKSGESYYLRILLNIVKGPTCYEDIRTVNGTIYPSYKDACYALGLLDDDKEYIASIKETHAWATASFCRTLFVNLITSDSISRPDHVFKETFECLSDDVVHIRARETHVPGMYY